VIYDVTHVTRFSYGATVELTNGVLRLTPRSENGQEVERVVIATDPVWELLNERRDSFGNRITALRIDKPHRQLSITATSRVRVDRPPVAAGGPTWESVAAEAVGFGSLTEDSPAVALYPSRRIALFEDATRYARESFAARRPICDAALELTRRIHADFTYDSDATEITTPASEAFDRRRGVCQDFANIMIAGLRGIALPALYVSGYIRTIPPPGKARLAGGDASHAWVSLWCGSAYGWKDYDPTNALPVQNEHIVVARGRDYSDVAPTEGMVLSSGRQNLEVEVDVLEVE
jgi:transglutaminase-like putative cysteine protease